MKLIFVGPPGAGKGTQAAKISEMFGIAHISTGDMLRMELRNGTELGNKARVYTDKGELVPDEIIIGMVKKRIAEDDCKNGFLFDGFPRTLAQADALSNITDIDMVIDIDVSADRLVNRVCGRRTCSECGAGYHISTYKADTCEKCGAKLFVRPDDNPDTVMNRIAVYEKSTAPLIEYYLQRGLLKKVNGDALPDEVLMSISKEVEKLK